MIANVGSYQNADLSPSPRSDNLFLEYDMKVQAVEISTNDQDYINDSGANVSGSLQPEVSEAVQQNVADMRHQSEKAAGFLKALAHPGRLLILCHLNAGEKSVSELEGLLSQRQAAVSQQLARLRMEGLVKARRDGKTIYYSIGDPKSAQMIALMYEMFCAEAR